MYYELYIDVLFFRNFLLDCLLLGLLNRLLGCSAGRVRRGLSAALGSAGVCILYLFSLEETSVGKLLIYVVLGTAMIAVGLRIRDWYLLGKAVILLYISSLMLGGSFQWIQQNFRIPVYPFLFFSLTSFSVLSASMEWLLRFRSRRQTLYETEIGFRGNAVQVKGLLDTGNHLHDPIFGRPVSILTEGVQRVLCGEAEILFLQIPFHSVGNPGDILPAFTADYLCIRRADGSLKRVEKPLLGVTKEPLSSQNEYEMILNPDLLDREH